MNMYLFSENNAHFIQIICLIKVFDGIFHIFVLFEI